MSDEKATSYYNILYEGVEASSPERAVSIMLHDLTAYTDGYQRTLVVTNGETGKDTWVRCKNGEIEWKEDDDE